MSNFIHQNVGAEIEFLFGWLVSVINFCVSLFSFVQFEAIVYEDFKLCRRVSYVNLVSQLFVLTISPFAGVSSRYAARRKVVDVW